LALVVGVACLLFTLGVGGALRSALNLNQRSDVREAVAPRVQSLARVIQARAVLLDGLEGFAVVEWEDPAELKREFGAFAKALAGNSVGVRNLVIAPDAVNEYVYPPSEEELVAGHDLLGDEREEVRQDVQRALESTSVVISGPYELRQGGYGMVLRQSVRVDGENWGIVATVLDAEAIFAVSGLATMPSTIDVAVKNERDVVFFGDAMLFDADVEQFDLKMPDGTNWTAVAAPADGWGARDLWQVLITVAFGTLGSLLAGALTYLMVQRGDRLRIAVDERTRELAEREEWFRAVVEQSRDGISVGRPDGEIVVYNDAWARISGYTIDQVLEHGWFNLAFPDPDERADAIKRATESLENDDSEIELEITRGDGSRIWASFSTTPVVLGGVPYNLSIMSDIEERKRAELRLESYRADLERTVAARTQELESLNDTLLLLVAELRESNVAKSRFLTNMSHELRTPLNSIIGFSEVMLQGLAGELTAEQRKQLEMILSSGKHLLSLINDILDLSRIEAGKVTIETSRFDFVDMVRSSVDLQTPAASDKGLAMVLKDPGCPVEMLSDFVKVRQILTNLVGNAVKFTHAGTVTVEIESVDADRASVIVSDTGQGIAPEIQAILFEEFVQGTSSGALKPEGTGLGLAISRRLAELLGGTLDLERTSSAGTSFRLVLPLGITPHPVAENVS
jgi:PAS domain S-box-containing protein